MNIESIQTHDDLDPEAVNDEMAAFDLLPREVRLFINEHGSLLNVEDVLYSYSEELEFDIVRTIAFIKDCNEAIGAVI